MSSIPVIQGNQGVLNKDEEPSYIRNGDYIDAKDVRFSGDEENTAGSHENIKGNTFSFDVGSTLPSSKQYKVCGLSSVAVNPSTTGWEYFGTPLSENFTSQACRETNMVEDSLNPGNIYLASAYQIWYFDSALNTWTLHSNVEPSFTATSTVGIRSVVLAISPAGILSCAYGFTYGTVGRLTVKKWDGTTWNHITPPTTGLLYSNGQSSQNPTVSYRFSRPELIYNGADLYLYFIGVCHDQNNLGLYLENYQMPRVFKHTGGSTITWSDVGTSLGAALWNTGEWGYPFIQSTGYSYIGKPIVIGTDIYFPYIHTKKPTPSSIPPSLFYKSEMYIAKLTGTSWTPAMPFTSISWSTGGRAIETSVNPQPFDGTFYAMPSISASSSGTITASFGISTSATTGTLLAFSNTAIAPTIWTTILSPAIFSSNSNISSVLYTGGNTSLVHDNSDNVYLAIADSSVGNYGGKSTVLRYDISLTAWDLADFQTFSNASILYVSKLSNINGVIHITYADYVLTPTQPFKGYATVQRYVGGGSIFNQYFTFTYSNGLEIGITGAVSSIPLLISEILLLFPPSQYTLTTNQSVSSNGENCLSFSIEPLDVNGGATPIAFNYYVTTSGLYSIEEVLSPIPIPNSGPNIIIGSYYLLNDCFVVSTPNNNNIKSDTVYTTSQIYQGISGLYLVIPKGSDIISGGYVQIFNIDGDPSLTGEHLCYIDSFNSTSDFVILLGYFPPNVISLTCTVRSVSVGYGNIGVAVRNENDGLWNYTRLLGHNLSLSTLNQVDMFAEINNRGKSLYITDNNNPVRSFHYYGDYITDGAYNDINPSNNYTKSGVVNQLTLQKGYSGAYIKYGGQGQGALNNGNYRYTVRFFTKDGVATSWSILSQPFSVYPEQKDVRKIYGGDGDKNSFRSNILNITWNQDRNYDYIEIGYTRQLSASGSAITSIYSLEQININRIKLDPKNSSLTYEHTGEERVTSDIPNGEISTLPFIIKKAKNIRSLDNRLVLSNVVVGGDLDLIPFFESLTYSLEKKPIPISGTYSPKALTQYSTAPILYPNYKTKSLGEYEIPENVFNFTGYMMNETYRFYGSVEFLDGSLSDAYHLFDVKIDTDPTSADKKRISGLSDYSINDGRLGVCLLEASSVYVPHIKVNIPTILPLIGGQLAKSVIRRIHIWREDVKKRTVIANGIGVLGVYDVAQAVYYKGASAGIIERHAAVIDNNNTSGSAQMCMFPLFSDEISGTGSSFIRAGLAAGGGWYGGSMSGGTSPAAKRDLITFFSPDFSMTEYRIEEKPTDKIINYGHYDNYVSCHFNQGLTDNQHIFGSFYYNRPIQPQEVGISQDYKDGGVRWVEAGEVLQLYKNGVSTAYEYYSKLMETRVSPSTYSYHKIDAGYVFFTDGDIALDQPAVGVRDYGVHYMSYYRPLSIADQYGDDNLGIAIPTGAYYDLQDDSTQLGTLAVTNTIDVFGGDTFTSKAILKVRSGYSADGTGIDQRYGNGIEYYCQSFINHQLRQNPEEIIQGTPQTNPIWPNDFNLSNTTGNFYQWFKWPAEEPIYNLSYSDKNVSNVLQVFDPNLFYENKLPSTFFYSDPKLLESLVDAYSYIKATNRKDLDITLGPINHHEIFNGELVSFQERAIQRQFFNTTAMLGDATTQIVLGDGGAVLSRRGMILSTYGLVNKWGVVKGRSKGGNDVIYWFDAINNKMMRFGSDGIVPISVRANMDTFFNNFTSFIQLYDTPAHGEGVHGVWDEKNSEVIFTFRAKKFVPDFIGQVSGGQVGLPVYYSEGDIVNYDANIGSESYDWHNTGEFYESLINLNPTTPSEAFRWVSIAFDDPVFIQTWRHIPHTDARYYNEFTVVFSEEKNGFTTLFTPKPKIYLQYKNTYLSPRPISPYSFVYEHDKGVECVWYALNAVDPINDPSSLKSYAYIEGVVNYNPELIKTAEAVSIDASEHPYIVEVRTNDHNTFMTSTDFVLAEGMYRSPVKNDTIGGVYSPDSDNSRVHGRWAALKYIMQYGYRQSIRSFVMKLRPRNRMYNK